MKVTKFTACALLLMFVGGCTFGVAEVEAGIYLMPVSILLFLFVLPGVAIIERMIDKERHPEKYLAKKQRKADREAAFERELAARREARRKAETIVEVKLIGGGSGKHTRYGVKGAVIGGLLFNVPGAIVGAMMPKGTKQMQRFWIRYEDGHTEIKEVYSDSGECKKLLKYVKW